jgi:hypothetical protein
MERVEDPLENKIPWFDRNWYRVGQDLVCMLSEKFPEKVMIRYSARGSGSVGGKFIRRSIKGVCLRTAYLGIQILQNPELPRKL